jgi:hypothetical protein
MVALQTPHAIVWGCVRVRLLPLLFFGRISFPAAFSPGLAGLLLILGYSNLRDFERSAARRKLRLMQKIQSTAERSASRLTFISTLKAPLHAKSPTAQGYHCLHPSLKWLRGICCRNRGSLGINWEECLLAKKTLALASCCPLLLRWTAPTMSTLH